MAEPINSPEDPIVQPTMDLKGQDGIPTIAERLKLGRGSCDDRLE